MDLGPNIQYSLHLQRGVQLVVSSVLPQNDVDHNSLLDLYITICLGFKTRKSLQVHKYYSNSYFSNITMYNSVSSEKQ